MLVISKKKLYLTRFLMWGGIVVVALGALISFATSSSVFTLVLIAAGFFVSLFGAVCMKRLFRCPNCKKNVLPDGSGVDIHTEKCPDRCPYCGTEVRME